MTDVVVTGCGLLTRTGIGWAALEDVLRHGPHSELPARVPGFSPRNAFRQRKSVKVADRRTALAVAAARLAREDAGLDLGTASTVDPARLAVVVGSTLSCNQAREMAAALEGETGALTGDVGAFGRAVMERQNPMSPLRHLPNMLSAHVAIEQGALGPSFTVTTAGCAGLQAIAEGAALVAGGEADAVFAGGAEDPLAPENRAVLRAAELDDDLAEAAAVLFLEAVGAAESRGADVRARVAGWGHGSGPKAVEEASRHALESTGWSGPPSVVYASGVADGGDRSWASSETATGRILAAAGAADAVLAVGRIGATRRALVIAVGPTGVATAVAFEETAGPSDRLPDSEGDSE